MRSQSLIGGFKPLVYTQPAESVWLVNINYLRALSTLSPETLRSEFGIFDCYYLNSLDTVIRNNKFILTRDGQYLCPFAGYRLSGLHNVFMRIIAHTLVKQGKNAIDNKLIVPPFTYFSIPKKNGKLRKIYAPNERLKYLLRLMNKAYQSIVSTWNNIAKETYGILVVGSIPGANNIALAAKQLSEMLTTSNSDEFIIVKTDLSDFFHSIPVGVLRKMFQYTTLPLFTLPKCFLKVKNNDEVLDIFKDWFEKEFISQDYPVNFGLIRNQHRFLPMGFPTSTVMSNIYMLAQLAWNPQNKILNEIVKGLVAYIDDITIVLPRKFLKVSNLPDDKLKEISKNFICNQLESLLSIKLNPDKTKVFFSKRYVTLYGCTIDTLTGKIRLGFKFRKKFRMYRYLLEKYNVELNARAKGYISYAFGLYKELGDKFELTDDLRYLFEHVMTIPYKVLQEELFHVA